MTDIISINTLDSWADFKSIIFSDLYRGEFFVSGRYLFRGHGKSEWELKSKYDRMFKEKKYAKPLVGYFRDLCTKNELFSAPESNDENKVLALGQHYGLPTRLLDWSDSPYIAAFFAFCDVNPEELIDKFVSIWVLNNKVNFWSEDIGLSVIDVPYLGNVRLKNQFGKFTKLDSPLDTIEEFIEGMFHKTPYKLTEPLLRKYNIPISEAKVALADLSSMGVDYFKIYPDLSGICFEARKKIIMDMIS